MNAPTPGFAKGLFTHLIVPLPPKLLLSQKIWRDSSLCALQEIKFHYHQGCISFAPHRQGITGGVQ